METPQKGKLCAPRAANLCCVFPRHYVDMPGKADLSTISYALGHAAGWEPYHLHDLENFFGVGSVRRRSFTNLSQQQHVRNHSKII